MFSLAKSHIYSGLVKKAYAAFASNAKSIEEADEAFFLLHKDIASGDMDAESIAEFLHDNTQAKRMLESGRRYENKVNNKEILETLGNLDGKFEDHKTKTEASLKKLVISASLYFVLPISLATNIATSYMNPEIVQIRQVITQLCNGKSSSLPKEFKLMPSHTPFIPKEHKQVSPKSALPITKRGILAASTL